MVILPVAMVRELGHCGGVVPNRTLDQMVVSSIPGLCVKYACVPGQNTLPLRLIICSDKTLSTVGLFYL